MTYSSQSLADPAGSSSLLDAVQWLQGTLLGTIATTVAVIAVAATGMMMLSGRIDVKRGVGVVIGCFILFGASSIAAGIQSFVRADESSYGPPVLPSPTPVQKAPTRSPQTDPYAGAAVPDG